MNNNYLNAIYNVDDELGVKMYGAPRWNALKGRVCAITDSLLEHPDAIARRPIRNGGRYHEIFTKLFRPDTKAAAELLGNSATDWIEDNVFNNPLAKVVKSGTHAASNVLAEIPFFSGWIKAGRSTNDFMSDVWDIISGKQVEEAKATAKKAAIGGGTLLLIGAGLGVWYFGFHKKKKRGRR